MSDPSSKTALFIDGRNLHMTAKALVSTSISSASCKNSRTAYSFPGVPISRP